VPPGLAHRGEAKAWPRRRVSPNPSSQRNLDRLTSDEPQGRRGRRVGFAKSDRSGTENILGLGLTAATCQLAADSVGLTMSAGQADTVGQRTRLSSAQASGWRESVEGDRPLRLSRRRTRQVPIPAAGFRRRALFLRSAVAN